MTIDRFLLTCMRMVVPSLCARNTSYKNDPNWSPKNPTRGHCTVVALLVQDCLGGELLRVSLKDTEFASGRFHYYNRLPNGTEVDLTRAQFRGRFPKGLVPIVRRRKEVLRAGDTAARYRRFRRRMNAMAKGPR